MFLRISVKMLFLTSDLQQNTGIRFNVVLADAMDPVGSELLTEIPKVSLFVQSLLLVW